MKEMVGGCCVCSDERGWAENPLVYCDGQGCTVAVHQACYGIVQVPTGPWFCRKCESQERCARVRCELCPSRDGALKRTDNGGWAHVVCALYIPEVRFGNVTTMEPIVLQLVPQDRFSKSCFICEQHHQESKASIGACMQCNKSGCKQYFHVTCAQAAGLLCEEAGNYMDNVKYCGYCPYHYQKVVSTKRDNNIKIIPAFKPIPAECDSREDSPERKPARARMKGGRSMSGERRGCSRPPCNGQVSSDGGASSDATEPRNGATSGGSSPSPSTGTPSTPLPQLPGKFTTANFTEATVVQTGSPVFGERQRKRGRPLGSTKEAKAQQAAQQAAAAAQAAQQIAAAQQAAAAQQQQSQPAQQQQQSPQQQLPVPLLQAKTEPLSPPPSSLSSTNPTPSFSSIYENLVGSSRHGEKRPKAKRPSPSQGGSSRASPSSSGERETAKNGSAGGSNKRSAAGSAGPRLRKKVPPMLSPSAQTAAAGGAINGLPPVMGSGDIDHTYYRELSPGGEEGSRPASVDSVLTQPTRLESDDATLESSNIQGKMLQPSEDHEDKSGRVSSAMPPEGWASACQVGPPRVSLPRSPAWPESAAVPSLIPQTLEQLLERQWDQGSGFLMRQAQHFDIASLLSCLHQLRSENMELESRISGLQARRDQLLAVSARLMGPLREAPMSNSPMPLASHASAAEANAAAAMSIGTRANLPTSSAGSSMDKHPGVPLGFPLGFPSSAQPATDHQPHQGNELSATSQHGFPGRPAMGHPEGVPSAENSSHRGSTLSTSHQSSNS
ncbi:coiled coil domain containing protein Alhambra isoform X3 [Rhipicephalus microplus]|uniref:coiled coil domain containing protein Alhambra isoform X3 n=1 Tax=Rhipicephalus microplus TaxID=6941 RepID=UPI003F6CE8B2